MRNPVAAASRLRISAREKTAARRRACLTIMLAIAAPWHAIFAEPDFDIDGFLVKHCFECHDDLVQKGDRRLDDLDLVIADVPMAHRWQEVLDVLALGEMPPEDELQPAPEERLAATDHLRTMLAEAAVRLEGESETVVMRRLNRIEYRNTMRELFGFVAPHYDPASPLPADEEDHGFFTIGETLMTSPLWLEGALTAAADAIDRALIMGDEKPEPVSLAYSAASFRPGRTQVKPEKAHGCISLYGRLAATATGISTHHTEGVPASGWYDFEVDAAAHGRVHRFDDWVFGRMDQDEPFLLAVGADTYDHAPNGNTQKTPEVLALLPITDDERTTHRARIWLEKGQTPVVLFWNGPINSYVALNQLEKTYPELHAKWGGGDTVGKSFGEKVELMTSEFYPGPRLRIWEMRIDGPHYDEWPSVAHQRLFGELGDEPDTATIRAQITAFARQAWRREPELAEIDRPVTMAEERIDEGMDAKEALRLPYKFILTSPSFLYLLEPVAAASRRRPSSSDETAAGRHRHESVTRPQLSSRLSYFLWSHPPDEPLRAADLLDPETRQAQIERMIDHEKIEQLAIHFTEQWLHLHDLGKMPPDDRTFRFYHEERLQEKMKRETALLFLEAIEKNLTVVDLLTAEHTWVDRPLAKHYGIDFTDLETDRFERVALPADSRRRGLLGHSGFLTVTSNGVETSPVIRGVWLLESILGTPPPAPPPDVPPLEPDIRGAATIREQLALHNDVETCAACHSRIDPLGFALEHFDPIGIWRGRYPDQAAIDPSTEYKGTAIANHDELVDYLASEEDLVARCLLEKMLTYATGRHLTFADEAEVMRLEKQWNEAGHGIRDLVRLVAGSALMARR